MNTPTYRPRTECLRERIMHSWNDWMQVSSCTLHIVYPGYDPKGRDREAHLYVLARQTESIKYRHDNWDRSLFTIDELTDLDELRELIRSANSLLQRIKEVVKEYEVVDEEQPEWRSYSTGDMLIPPESPVVELAKELMAVCAAANELIYQAPCVFFTPPRGWKPEGS